MRCYFLRDNRIEAVEMLKPGPDDELIRQAKELFQKRRGMNLIGFEVWDGRRLVYRSADSDRPSYRSN
jgi:hypothetical protein